MNKEKILQMTSKEIEIFLNDNISTINIESEHDTDVKGMMIDSVKTLFDDTVKISIPYYTNRELLININNLSINFKVSTKKTGKIVKVSRLRKKDIKTIGKFRFSDISISFFNPHFEADDLDNFKIIPSQDTCTGGPSISLKHRKEKLIDMLTKDILLEEIQSQDENWKDVRKTVILNASQPKIKQEYFKPDFNQGKWDIILQKTEDVNKELIDSEIEKMFKVFN